MKRKIITNGEVDLDELEDYNEEYEKEIEEFLKEDQLTKEIIAEEEFINSMAIKE